MTLLAGMHMAKTDMTSPLHHDYVIVVVVQGIIRGWRTRKRKRKKRPLARKTPRLLHRSVE